MGPLFWLEKRPSFGGLFRPKIEDISRFQVYIYILKHAFVHTNCVPLLHNPYKNRFELTYQTPTWNIILLKKNCGNWSKLGWFEFCRINIEKTGWLVGWPAGGSGKFFTFTSWCLQGIVHTDSYLVTDWRRQIFRVPKCPQKIVGFWVFWGSNFIHSLEDSGT